jgi:expansin (peptidoglycan-binding protein)
MGPGQHGRRGARWPLFGLGGLGAVAAVIVVAVGIGQVAGGRACASVGPAVATTTGTATHYVLTGTGNCSYPSPPADGLFVALSPAEYHGAAACGGYVEVSGPHGSVRAEVIDQCPPCAAGHIDLSEAAFARIAPLSAGLVSITYRAVADPPLPAPVSVRVKEGSSRYWLALLAMNTGNPLASVQVESAPGGWRDLVRADYDYWIASSGAGTGPFTVRLTDTAGHRVTVRGVTLDPGVVQRSGIRMYGAGSAAAPAAPAPVSASVSSVPSATAKARRVARQRVAASAPASARSGSARPVPASSAPAWVASQAPAAREPAPRSPSAAPSC